MYSDLESDYINPIDLCSKLNQVRFTRAGNDRLTHSLRSQRWVRMPSSPRCSL